MVILKNIWLVTMPRWAKSSWQVILAWRQVILAWRHINGQFPPIHNRYKEYNIIKISLFINALLKLGRKAETSKYRLSRQGSTMFLQLNLKWYYHGISLTWRAAENTNLKIPFDVRTLIFRQIHKWSKG